MYFYIYIISSNVICVEVSYIIYKYTHIISELPVNRVQYSGVTCI